MVPVPKSLVNAFFLKISKYGHFSNQYIIQGEKNEICILFVSNFEKTMFMVVIVI